MKTFKEYLTESKKVYSFKVKVAGDLPENFAEDLKKRINDKSCIKLEEIDKVPAEKLPLDFPECKESEIHVLELICEYPVTAPELINEIAQMGLEENSFRVRGSSEPSEIDQLTIGELQSEDGLLNDPSYSEKGPAKIKAKDYFGDGFNKGFLKDLSKTAKDKKKDGKGFQEYEIPAVKADKAGLASPVGSK